MKIAILGYGKEGQSAETYLRSVYPDALFETFSDFDAEKIKTFDLPSFNLIVRSPSVPPRWLEAAGLKPQKTDISLTEASSETRGGWTSATRLFFERCPAPIIGVTGTKGKGTTSSLIAKILEALGHKVHLVGNIGTPALDCLAEISAEDFVIYELSSFQLWDLEKSPRVAVILGIEPDHLNVHSDYADYLRAKGNIARFQAPSDACVYYAPSLDASGLALESPARHFPYPLLSPDNTPTKDPADHSATSANANAGADLPASTLNHLLDQLYIPGAHNRDNAQAALLAVAAALDTPLETLLKHNLDTLSKVFREFKGLPHRLEFLRELNGVKYYDDNFSTNLASTRVALAAFPGQNLILIAGGRDKTAGADLPALAELIRCDTAATLDLEYCIVKAVLIGESGRELAKILPADTFELADTLESAVHTARTLAESLAKDLSTDNPGAKSVNKPIVLMSPAAASFDMFENVYDRGAQYQKLIKELR